MSEMNQLKNMEKAIPNVHPLVKTVLAYAAGKKLAGGSGPSGFGKTETTNRMVDRAHEANVQDEMKNRDTARELKKGKQFANYKAQESKQSHNQALEKQRFEADTVHEFATRYPHATEIKHGSTSVKFSKRGSSKSTSGSTPSKPKNAKKTSNKKIK